MIFKIISSVTGTATAFYPTGDWRFNISIIFLLVLGVCGLISVATAGEKT